MKITFKELIERCDCNSKIKIFPDKNLRNLILEEDAMKCSQSFDENSTAEPRSKHADFLWRIRDVEINSFKICSNYSDHFPTVEIYLGR